MTDEEVVAWFFDFTERLHVPCRRYGPELFPIMRDTWITATCRKPDAVAAIREAREHLDREDAA